ncbi:hypothetical protein J2S09_003663 [Bacillus fengqiuensis]|nr:hypothetical protein [Bacillus fengqiuensis]
MNEVTKRLIRIFKSHEGEDFDATLQDELDGAVGFHFMSYIKTAKIHTGVERVTVSEPLTGKYFCLPLRDIAEIRDESAGKYDLAYIVKYRNGYNVFIPIFKQQEIYKGNFHQRESYYTLIREKCEPPGSTTLERRESL